MKSMLQKAAVLTAAVFMFWNIAGAQENFNLDSMNAGDIEFSQDKGILDWIKPDPKPEPKTEKEWTIMVFMNAKNDLSEGQLFGLVGKWADKDLKEMKKVGTTDKVNIVVEYGKKGEGSKRVLIKKGGLFSSGEVVYGEYPDTDMGDWRRVAEFVKWGREEFPSKKTMLVLWNHGLGWLDPDLSQINAGTGTSGKGILFDDDTKNYVKTKELGEMMKRAGYVDVFVMNACLMQMAEVAYEIKDYADLIVASEETMLAFGFDYEKLLNFMNAKPGASNARISDFFINWYRQFFAEGISVGPISVPTDSIAATLSTLNPGALNRLPAYLNAFSAAVTENCEKEALKHAIQNVIRFTSLDPKNNKEKMLSSYADLYDFAFLVAQKAENQATVQAAENLMTFIKSELVLRSVGLNRDATNGYDYSKVGGIAIETTRKLKKDISEQFSQLFETDYSEIALSRNSQWDEFVDWSNKVWLE